MIFFLLLRNCLKQIKNLVIKIISNITMFELRYVRANQITWIYL